MTSSKRKPEKPSIKELQTRIKDENYIQSAILRIAQILSDELAEIRRDTYERKRRKELSRQKTKEKG